MPVCGKYPEWIVIVREHHTTLLCSRWLNVYSSKLGRLIDPLIEKNGCQVDYQDHVTAFNVLHFLKLCCSKIAWNNYALLQMILEYFPTFGRSLHCVKISKKPSSFVKFEHEETSCHLGFWMLVDPGNECHNPWCNALKSVGDGELHLFSEAILQQTNFTKLNDVLKRQNLDLLALGTIIVPTIIVSIKNLRPSG